jgi:signal transduction histidine kinase
VLVQDDSFATLVRLASDWCWERDADYRLTSVRAEGAQIPESVLAWRGCAPWDVPHLLALSSSWAEHRAVVARREAFRDFQYAVLPPDGGAPRYFASSGEPRVAPDGTYLGYVGLTREVTQQWQAQHRQEDAASMTRVAAALGRFAAWSLDLATGAVQWSPEVMAIPYLASWKDYTLRDVLARHLPECQQAVVQAYERCRLKGTPFDLELRSTPAHGDRWVRIIGMPVRDLRGHIVRLQGAVQDITGEKRAAEAQSASNERLRRTLDGLADAFGTIDSQWRVTYMNRMAQQVMRVTWEQAQGRLFWEVFPGVVGNEFEARYRQVMRDRQPAQFEAYYEPLGLWARVSSFPCEDGIAISFSDITQARVAQERLAALNARLEQRVNERTRQLETALEELECFAYAVAHDLRSPLAAIRGFSSALQGLGGDLGAPRAAHLLQRIQVAGQQMDEMTESLLSLAKLSSTTLAPELVDLTEISRNCLAGLRATEPRPQMRWLVHDALWADGDRGLLMVLMQNLISNAWKYSRATPSPRIEVGMELGPGKELRYFVRDNGCGFDPSQAAQIFEPFHRLHGKDVEGSGIGLATVKRIVARHGGRAWAIGAPGQGATFFFTLGG